MCFVWRAHAPRSEPSLRPPPAPCQTIARRRDRSSAQPRRASRNTPREPGYLQLGSRSHVVSATTHGAITIATYASPAKKSCIAFASSSIQRSATQLTSSLSANPRRTNRRSHLSANLGHSPAVRRSFTHATQSPTDAKRPPGNRATFSLGRIVPTEAKPSELSGCILSLATTCVKAKTMPM
jgi:hypothetical protein